MAITLILGTDVVKASRTTTNDNFTYLDSSKAPLDSPHFAGNIGIGTSTPGSKLSIVGLPTSSAGLSAGDIWNDGGTLKIV